MGHYFHVNFVNILYAISVQSMYYSDYNGLVKEINKNDDDVAFTVTVNLFRRIQKPTRYKKVLVVKTFFRLTD